MAIYRLEAKAISRGQGRSCIAAAAYRHACELRDERQQMVHRYLRKGGADHSEIIAPPDALPWMLDRERLWNGLDAAEKRKDAITAREVLVSLPRELSDDDQVELVRDLCRTFTARGIIADVAIHRPVGLDSVEQPHAHIMLADRPVDGSSATGFAAKKDRTLATPDGVEALRETWATSCNQALERASLGERVDHRSLARQAEAARDRGDTATAIRLDRPPEPKIGPTATAMVRAGRGDQALAWRDTQAARLARQAAEAMAATWRTLVAEATELAARVKAAVAPPPPLRPEIGLDQAAATTGELASRTRIVRDPVTGRAIVRGSEPPTLAPQAPRGPTEAPPAARVALAPQTASQVPVAAPTPEEARRAALRASIEATDWDSVNDELAMREANRLLRERQERKAAEECQRIEQQQQQSPRQDRPYPNSPRKGPQKGRSR